jgi:SAM-dependent methyltransferase
MAKLKNDEIREAVRETYGKVAEAETSGCGCDCGPGTSSTLEEISVKLGYSTDDISSVPQGANMGLGCGNPQVVASLKAEEIVLDLGSGGGFDCFLAAKVVGERGQIIGVDFTPEMIIKARENAQKMGLKNVEFRLGEIEHLPVANNSVDVIISNCVINLSPEKGNVFKEAFRVLKEGGRLAISDIVATAQLPDEVRTDLAMIAGCTAGAAHIDELESLLEEVGFINIRIKPWDGTRELIREWSPDRDIGDFVVSASIDAVKPTSPAQKFKDS